MQNGCKASPSEFVARARPPCQTSMRKHAMQCATIRGGLVRPDCKNTTQNGLRHVTAATRCLCGAKRATNWALGHKLLAALRRPLHWASARQRQESCFACPLKRRPHCSRRCHYGVAGIDCALRGVEAARLVSADSGVGQQEGGLDASLFRCHDPQRCSEVFATALFVVCGTLPIVGPAVFVDELRIGASHWRFPTYMWPFPP